jgi:hypothetical protein
MALFRPLSKSSSKVRRPEFLTEFIARNHVTGMLQQKRKPGRVGPEASGGCRLVHPPERKSTLEGAEGVLWVRAAASIEARACRYSITDCLLKEYVPNACSCNSPEFKKLSIRTRTRTDYTPTIALQATSRQSRRTRATSPSKSQPRGGAYVQN